MGFLAIREPFFEPIRPTHYRLVWKQGSVGTVSVRCPSCGDAISDREERLEE